MKRVALVACLLLVVPIVSCSWVKKMGNMRPLFGKKVDVHSSSAKLMTAYKEYAMSGNAAKLWTLYSDDLKARMPEEVSGLEDELSSKPISEIYLGNPTPFSGKILYFNTVIYKDGSSMLEKVEVMEIEGKWFIVNLTPNVE